VADVYRIGKKWGGCYTDHNGTRRQKVLSWDKATARQMLRQLELRSQRIRAGLEAATDIPLAPLLADWAASLASRAVTYRTQQVDRVALLLCDCVTLADVTPAVVERAARKLTAGDVTKGYYIQAARQFCRWLVSRGYLVADPLRSVARPPARHATRRALTEEEITRLLVSPRWPRYAVALGTGFRVSELRSLTAEDFRGNYVTLAAEHAKNRQAVAQPLPVWLQEMLSPWLPGRSGILFPSGWSHAARTLRSDAESTGVCFHCLRHTYITSLVTAGLPPATVQRLARHSDFRLTFNLYTHLPDVQLSCAMTAWRPAFAAPAARSPVGQTVLQTVALNLLAKGPSPTGDGSPG
jgi:integrase/recombinase XerD